MNSRISFLAAMGFLLAQGPAAADGVTITLRELGYKQKIVSESVFAYDLDSFRLATATKSRETHVPSISKYVERDGKLLFKRRAVAGADEILIQCTVGTSDLVIVGDEYNSFANPLHIFGAMIGHPVKINRIILIHRVDDETVAKLEILRMHSLYSWGAEIHQ